MNPVAAVMIIVGMLLMIIGFRGKQDNLVAAVTGKKYGKSTLK